MSIHKSSSRLMTFLSASIIFGNIIISLWHLIGPAWIIFGLRTEVLSGTSYSYPLETKLMSFFGFALVFLFFISQIKSWRVGGWWRWLLLGCLLFFLMVDIHETIMASRMDGFSSAVMKHYFYDLCFVCWILLNYYFWIVFLPKSRNHGRTSQ